jgi:ferredoxin-type protein NapH
MNDLHRQRFLSKSRIMFGREPKKPVEITERAQQVHELKRMANKTEVRAIMLAHETPHGNTWRNRRWAVLIAVNLFFVVSFGFDIQILEGALTASRFIGFHLIDLNSALQVMLAHKHIIVNLLIGTMTVLVIWMLLGGRTFCSWVCPYHLIAEWAEKLHLCPGTQKTGDRPEHEPQASHGVLAYLCVGNGGFGVHRF